MQKLFNHMLVPVEQGDDEDILHQALHMAESLQCHVHLLYHAPSVQKDEDIDLLKAAIRRQHPLLAAPAISLDINTDPTSTERQIVDYSKKNAVDLILLIRKKRASHPIFRKGTDVDWLVDKTLCPVLTISDTIPSLKNIVLPVGDQLPMRRLLFATYLGRTAGATIHLITSGRDLLSGPEAQLQKCYRLLKENTSLSIECEACREENLAEAAWDYAKRIKADLILASPGKEAMLSGFWNSLRSKLFHRLGSRSLSSTSQIPVMTISTETPGATHQEPHIYCKLEQ
jgi:hypothetical protein